MWKYISDNIVVGLKTDPRNAPLKSIIYVPVFFVIALLYGFHNDIFQINLIGIELVFILPFILFVFPSFLEEIVFRGLLIPNRASDKGVLKVIFYIIFSSLVYTIWHPLNAITINRNAINLFLDIHFLFIVFFLGVICGYSYVYSRSLWVPILIHWITVMVWVSALGGRNLALGVSGPE